MYLVQRWQGVYTSTGPTPQNTIEVLTYIVPSLFGISNGINLFFELVLHCVILF